MAENNQKIKLLKIMEYLRSESDANNPISTSQIISYLNSINISCERRTLYKDMEMLIDNDLNIVKTELGRENAYYINKVSFSLAELKILMDAVEAANFITKDKTAELTDKIRLFINMCGNKIAEKAVKN